MRLFSTLFIILFVLSACSHKKRECAPIPIIKAVKPYKPFKNPYSDNGPIPYLAKKGTCKGVIVLDAGHGGTDLGAHSSNEPTYQEKLLTLSTAKMVKTYLEKAHYKVLMTRSSDIFIPLDERAKFANDNNPLLFVSIHYNSAPNKEADGIEVFYYRNKDSDKERTQQSKLLAEAVLKHATDVTGAHLRSVKHGNFVVIRTTEMPSILVECGFLTNDEELKNIKNSSYLKKLAYGISKGILSFVKEEGNVLGAN